MSTQKPDPYNIDGPDEAEHFVRQDEVDERARPTRHHAQALEPGRACATCGYDLSGLFVGGACPECGDTILSVAPASDIGELRRTPRWYLRLLEATLCGMVLIVVVVVAIAMHTWWMGSGSSLPSGALMTIVRLATLGWIACVVIISLPPPVTDPARPAGRSWPEVLLSIGAVVSQLGFFVATFHGAVLTNAHPAWVAWPMTFSVLGLVVVGFQLSKISWRLNDPDRALRLQTASVSIPLGYVVMVGMSMIIAARIPSLRLFGVPFMIVFFIGMGMLACGVVYVLWSAWSLGREASWAIKNIEAAEAKAERMKQRARDNYEQAQRDRQASEPFGGPLP